MMEPAVIYFASRSETATFVGSLPCGVQREMLFCGADQVTGLMTFVMA